MLDSSLARTVAAELSPPALRALAKAYRNMALELEARARALEERDCAGEAFDRRQSEIARACARVEHMITTTRTPVEEAVGTIYQATDIAPDVLRYHLLKRRRLAERAATIQRNREIMRLADRGWSNARIAQRLDLHPSSVSRILQRQLKGSVA